MFGFENPQGGFKIGGITTAKPPGNAQELVALTQELAPAIARRVPTEQDCYWFVIEQYDRLHGQSPYLNELLGTVGLHEIEYAGMRSEESYVGKPNPGVIFFQREIVLPLASVFDKQATGYASIVIFTGFCQIYSEAVAHVRKKYATHYHNNCISQGSYRSADRWVEVLDSL
jgi:hypothetical protein